MNTIHPEKFAHVLYRTRRFDAMVAWYETVFGAKVRHRNPAMAFLSYDDEHHRFAFLNLAAVQPDGTEMDRRGAVGVDHLAYTYGSLNDLLARYSELRAMNIRPYWCVHHGFTVSMYYADPDGNQMEFQIECFDTAEQANSFIEGPAFEVNPIGVEFDPDDWLRRLNAGATVHELLQRTVHEPVSPIRGSAALAAH